MAGHGARHTQTEARFNVHLCEEDTVKRRARLTLQCVGPRPSATRGSLPLDVFLTHCEKFACTSSAILERYFRLVRTHRAFPKAGSNTHCSTLFVSFFFYYNFYTGWESESWERSKLTTFFAILREIIGLIHSSCGLFDKIEMHFALVKNNSF